MALETNKKNEVLNCVAKNLIKDSKTLIAENKKDMDAGKANGMPEGLLDRLLLTEKRIEQMAEGLEQVAALDDLIGGSPFHENVQMVLGSVKNVYHLALSALSMKHVRM